jgi:hypothetical protein
MIGYLLYGFHALCRFIHAPQSVQTPGIPDVGQTLGDDFDEKRLIVAHFHITSGVAGELWLTTALCR